ncbi:MAG: TrkA family potassium uptake protein [Anaerolineae bacterium]|nr:TrkA family potassium uptake protein [Anaerolineae bacterium]
MKVLIIGAGRTGAQLAISLLSQDYDVNVVDNRREVLSRIHRELPTEIITEGDPLEANVLEKAGIQNADVMAAVTTSDETNLVLCYFARHRYHVPRVIARVNNPRDSWLFNDTFCVDVAVNQADILSRLIQEEMSMGDMMTLLKLRRGNYSLVEEKIPDGAPAIGVAIKDLPLPEHCVIAAIIRQGGLVIPRGVTALEAGDEVLAVTDTEGADKLSLLLSRPEGQ